jgi:Cdc6-like AAA superfamily ATPase
MTQQEKARLIVQCGRVFSPSAPVNSLDLFAGRINEIQKVSSAVNTRGRHTIMYGDRGVGKTSLANILQEVLQDISDAKVVKINCNENDDYRSVWRRAFTKIPVIYEAHQDEQDQRPTEYSLDQYLEPVRKVG